MSDCKKCCWHPDGILAGIPLDRLTEICNAERDGRLVVLPCKVGDTLWLAYDKKIIPCRVQGYQLQGIELSVKLNGSLYLGEMDYIINNFFGADCFGKTVFLTREAAEAALKGAEHERD